MTNTATATDETLAPEPKAPKLNTPQERIAARKKLDNLQAQVSTMRPKLFRAFQHKWDAQDRGRVAAKQSKRIAVLGTLQAEIFLLQRALA